MYNVATQESNLKIFVMNYNRQGPRTIATGWSSLDPIFCQARSNIHSRMDNSRTGSETHLECRQDIIVRPSSARDCCLRNRDCRLFTIGRTTALIVEEPGSTLSPFFPLTNEQYAPFSLNIIFMRDEKCARQTGRAFAKPSVFKGN